MVERSIAWFVANRKPTRAFPRGREESARLLTSRRRHQPASDGEPRAGPRGEWQLQPRLTRACKLRGVKKGPHLGLCPSRVAGSNPLHAGSWVGHSRYAGSTLRPREPIVQQSPRSSARGLRQRGPGSRARRGQMWGPDSIARCSGDQLGNPKWRSKSGEPKGREGPFRWTETTSQHAQRTRSTSRTGAEVRVLPESHMS